MNNAVQRVYVEIEESGLTAYSVIHLNNENKIDTVDKNFFPQKIDMPGKEEAIFHKHSLDFDFMTIPLKLRPAQSNVPAQLNTHLNGALYAGYRNDRFRVGYNTDPLMRSELKTNHFGISIGVFSGIGGTFMSPTTTNFKIDKEYDGVVWCNGLAVFIGVNRFTVGLAAGIDHLTDSNRFLWIYQNKPWLGLSFGLNLN
jgi:hypothetical protein